MYDEILLIEYFHEVKEEAKGEACEVGIHFTLTGGVRESHFTCSLFSFSRGSSGRVATDLNDSPPLAVETAYLDSWIARSNFVNGLEIVCSSSISFLYGQLLK